MSQTNLPKNTQSTNPKAIQIQNLTKVYSAKGKPPFQALNGVNLEVEAGDFFSLLGANGAGKTTIIGIITGLVNKTAGNVKIFGYDIDTGFVNAKRQIGVVPQEFNFNMFEKVGDIIIGQAGYYGIPRTEAEKYCDELLEKLDLVAKKNMRSVTLSGGMKRRLMIARALIHKPRLLILDEPTAGVDVELRRGMWDFLTELNQAGTTILLTTHYLEEVEKLCKNASIIKKGQIIQTNSVKNLLSQNSQEKYIVEVDQEPTLGDFYGAKFNDNKLEIIVNKENGLGEILKNITEQGIKITGVYPQSNRLEELFLN
jgi:ABC-2 type transport system ATP-binding protein